MFEMMGLQIPLALPRLPPVMDVHGGGGTAVLFEPLNAAQCLAALEELASSQSRRVEIAAAAYAKLISEHPWRHTAEQILAKLPA
jgi:coproporphyrinogen III oxidase-like Fe-S oxidoreductase